MTKRKGPTGRIMALDLGEKRIGVAISDEGRAVARSHSIVRRGARRDDFASLGRIAKEEGVSQLLVGLPISLSEEGEPLEEQTPRIAWMRDYAAALAEALGLPVRFWDESLSTVEANASLRARGGGRRGEAAIDAVAAAIILQSFLDHGATRGDRAAPA